MGSRFGWILAAFVGAVAALVILKVVYVPSPTPPTRATTAAGMLSLQRPREPISLALGRELSAEGDAGEDYRRALEAYQGDLAAVKGVLGHYVEMAKGEYRLSDDEVETLERVAEPISAGAAKKKFTYYFRLTPQEIELPSFRPAESTQFQNLAEVPQMLAVHYVATGEDGFSEAERYLLDVLVMGYHLMAERARMEIVQRGIGLQEAACGLLASLYQRWNKPQRAEQVRRYSDGLWNIGSAYSDLFEVIWRIEQHGKAYGPHPGDVCNLAANHRDRAVVVEAILGLGVVKLTTAARRGDQMRVRRLIREKLESKDVIERAAARCADGLDAAGLRRLAASE
jgi:hypothetical protein